MWEPAMEVYGELVRRHLQAARAQDEVRRLKLFRLIEDIKREWPDEAKHWDDRWSVEQ